ncbi:AAA family ATPase [Amycolatopsis sp. NPDC051128]|uniref:ATP-binding protein n=1 Tax=Amycolatopsis sp. NPDC051128 TaxID=3155412 RepID=UPI003446DF67
MEALPFTGRGALLGEIGAALERARSGHGGLVLLTGPAGTGKTRLAAEAVAGATRAVWAWCPGDGVAFGPWSLIVRDLVTAGGAAGRLAGTSPAVQGLIAGQVADPPRIPDPEGARLRLTGEVAALLRSCAATDPLLIVLDDVHAADPSTLRLLLELAATARTSRILLLGTARDDDFTWAERVEARASLFGRALCLRVGPLTPDDVGALLTSATGTRPSDDEVQSVLGRTGGDAFLVTELIRDQANRGPGEGVPPSVRAAVEARIAALPPACAEALAAAATLGVRVRLDLLAELTGVALGRLRALLAAASDAGLLGDLGPGLLMFRHDLLRDAVYFAQSPSARASSHRQAAEVLARLAERGRDVGPAEVAHHLLLAGPEHAGPAAAAARRAGDRAAELLAYDDALRWYERSAHAARSTASTDSERADLLLAQGTARLGAGDRAGARANFLRAAELARTAGRADLLAHAALGLGSGPAGLEVDLFDREQIDLLTAAAGALSPAEPALLAATLARLSVATTVIDPLERRAARATEALRLARQSEDPAALVQALAAQCDVRSGPEHCAERLGWAEEIIGLARRLPDAGPELLGRRLKLVALLETGAVAAADTEVLAFETAARPAGNPLHDWYVPLWRGMRALAEGRFDDCAAALDTVEDLGHRAGSGNALMLATTQRWFLLTDTGDRAAIERLIADSGLEDLAGVWPRVTLALAAAQLGRAAEARDRLSALAPRLGEAPRDSEWLPMLSQIAETVAIIGDHPLCRPVYAWMSPFAGRFVVEGIGAALRGPVSWYLSLLAKASGDADVAKSHAETALAAARSVGATWLAGRIERELGASAPAAGPDVFAEDGVLWLLRFGGHDARLSGSKGLRDLACLLARPGVPVPALDLVTARSPGVTRSEDVHAEGDLGEVLDATARAAYRKRLRELTAEADDADAAGDSERSAKLAVERDALVDQLSAAYGLGGRPRRAGSPAERARTAVTARIRATIDRIGRVHPELGRHLRASIRTGTVCVYEPETPRRWELGAAHRATESHASSG